MTLTKQQLADVQAEQVQMLKTHYLPEGTIVTLKRDTNPGRNWVFVSKIETVYLPGKNDGGGYTPGAKVEGPMAVDITHLVATILKFKESRTNGCIITPNGTDLVPTIAERLYGRKDALVTIDHTV